MAEARTRAEMLALVQEWETSGESRRVFTERHALSLPRFDYWRQQLRRERRRERGETFAPVRVVADTTAPVLGGAVEIVLATGDRVIIREGVTPSCCGLRTIGTRQPASCSISGGTSPTDRAGVCTVRGR